MQVYIPSSRPSPAAAAVANEKQAINDWPPCLFERINPKSLASRVCSRFSSSFAARRTASSHLFSPPRLPAMPEPPKKRQRTGPSAEELIAIAPGLRCVPCNRDSPLKTEKRFKWRLTMQPAEPASSSSSPPSSSSSSSSFIADAWVLDNNISVVTLDRSVLVNAVTFLAFTADAVYGKQKKGAMKTQAMQPICSLSLPSGERAEVLSPISGRIIELNDRLLSSPSLLSTHHASDGYLLLIQSEVPKLIDKASGVVDSLDSLVDPANQRLCFAWSKGNCIHGDSCKYEHSRSDARLPAATTC